MLTGILLIQNGKRIFIEAEWIDHDHISVEGYDYKVYRERYCGCLVIRMDGVDCPLQSKGEEEWDDRPEENLPRNEYLQEVKRLQKQYDNFLSSH